jgi:hypothetical protein
MTVWTGVYQQVGGDGEESGIIAAPTGSDSITADQYYLMSNLKWPMLDRITSARLHNGDVRDALVTFLSSECGDALAKAVEPGNLIAASNSKTGQLPYSIFRGVKEKTGSAAVGTGGSCQNSPNDRDYSNVTKLLSNQLIPIPRSVRRSWWNADRAASGSSTTASDADLRGTLPGFYTKYDFSGYTAYTPPSNPFAGFPGFGGSWWSSIPPFIRNPSLPGGSGTGGSSGGMFNGQHIDTYLKEEDNMSCADLLFYAMNGLRWEAGQIYYQLISTAPRNMNSDQVIYNLFYGWDLRNQCGEKLNTEGIQHFLKDLILIHLVRNEMAVAPKVVDSRYSGQSAAAANPGNRMIAESGAKAKFGEVYTWALMMPYVQGVLLYLLAMAYPFVCVMIVVPGWHKTLFTWMSFWTWVKLWDLGFAVVLVLERSIWAVMGNNSTAQSLSGRIAEMQTYGKVFVDSCSRTVGGECPTVPLVYDQTAVSGLSGLQEAWKNLVSILDRSMLVGSSIDFDVQNGYYIYIMSALYFAVPAVTGQLVLGAKAGAAGMVGNLTQGAQGDGGKAAQSAFTGSMRNVAGANAASVAQGSAAKAFRNDGLALGAIEAGNNQALQGLMQNEAGAKSTATGMMSSMNGMSAANARSNLQMGMQWANVASANPKTLAAAAATGLGAEGLNRVGGAPGGPTSQAPLFPDRSSGGGGVPSSGGGGSGGGGGNGVPNNGSPSPSGGTPSTGGGRTGNGAGMQGFGISGQALNGLADPQTAQAAKQLLQSTAQAMSDNALTVGYNNRGAGLTSNQAGFNAAGFQAGGMSSGYGQQQQRGGAHANFAAESAAWEAKRDFANQSSGYLSAIGVDSSVVGPGSKPGDMMGMAMSGMLGSSAKSAAGYFNNGGGFFGEVGQRSNDVNSNYGAGAVGSYYNTGSVAGELNGAWGRLASVSGEFSAASDRAGESAQPK